MAIELKIPAVGESITEVEIGGWLKAQGDSVKKDEAVVTLESEKATVELPAPVAGTLSRILKKKGDTAAVGEVIAYIENDGKQEKSAQPAGPKNARSEKEPEKPPRTIPAGEPSVAEKRLRPEEVRETNPGTKPIGKAEATERGSASRSTSDENGASPEKKAHISSKVLRLAEPRSADFVHDLGPGDRSLKEDGAGEASPTSPAPPAADEVRAAPAGREEEIVPMTRLRRTVAERLIEAQNTMALLTTFNEIDMSAVLALRKGYGETFQKKYNVKLGLMSFFVTASIEALKLIPQVNAEIRGADIVFHNYYDIGVAIGSGKGLVVPVLRNAERLSFAQIELAIGDFARRAQENKLQLEELRGGTFTISNGGIYGSMLSTPLVNPPQSGILGMHAIQERPVAREGAVVIRPMMYVALTYDHRIVDGREAVTFLNRIKEMLEEPSRILLEV